MVWDCILRRWRYRQIYQIVMSPALKLDRDGFTFTAFFREKRYAWSEISEPFRVWVVRSRAGEQPMVVFSTTQDEGWLSKKFTGGANASLPDTYGMSARDLASTMNAWRTGTAQTS